MIIENTIEYQALKEVADQRLAMIEKQIVILQRVNKFFQSLNESYGGQSPPPILEMEVKAMIREAELLDE